MSILRRFAGVLALTALLAGCADGEARRSAAPAPDQPPAQVTVAEVTRQLVTLERVYPGRAQAADDVEVRARVQGILLERRYQEGARVKAGTVLFRIEPAPYQARVQQAQAELQRANAQLRQAQREWQRVSALFKEKAVSARQRDEAQSTLDLAQAAVANAEAMLRTARIDLDHTEVRAPIGGVTGLRAVSQGNLVNPGDMLTSIRQLDPIHVLFSLPEADAIAQRRQFGLTGAAPAADRRPVAQALLPDGSVYEREGVIDFIAASVDPQTGTVQARGVFPNPQGVLVPGQFLRISVGGVQLPDTVVVPGRAVAQGPQGPVVYVVDEQDLAQERPVTLGQAVAQGRVITSGLRQGEKVIVDGIIGVQVGKRVQATPADSTARVENGQGAASGAASPPAGAAR